MSATPQVEGDNGAETAVTLKLKPENLETLKAIAKIDTNRELAKRLGINQSNLSRILSGTAQPGVPFIAGCVNIFGPRSIDMIFEVVPDSRAGATA